MEYIMPKDASQVWSISERLVVSLEFRRRRVNGAQRIGSKMWVIPKDASKPIAGRAKAPTQTLISSRREDS